MGRGCSEVELARSIACEVETAKWIVGPFSMKLQARSTKNKMIRKRMHYSPKTM